LLRSTACTEPWQMQDRQCNIVIPVFSSIPRLEEMHAGRITCAQVKGSKLLDLSGTEKPFILTLVSEDPKEFTPRELADLQVGQLFKDPEYQTLASDGKVTPGLPAGYPEALIDGFKSLFAHYPETTKAYLASMDSADSDTLPSR
jgi:hypothetical protein